MIPFFDRIVAMAVAKGYRFVVTPPCPCPFCGFEPKGVALVHNQPDPKEGDGVVCPGCAVPMVFAADLSRAPMTRAAYDAMTEEQRLQVESARDAHLKMGGLYRGTPGPWPPPA
jgi:hypothetical protein